MRFFKIEQAHAFIYPRSAPLPPKTKMATPKDTPKTADEIIERMERILGALPKNVADQWVKERFQTLSGNGSRIKKIVNGGMWFNAEGTVYEDVVLPMLMRMANFR